MSCPEPYSMSRAEIVDAMSRHGSYSITSTTTSMRFGAEALLAMVRARQKADRSQTQLIIRQDDWFAAHVATAGVSPSEMSEAARSGFEHHQDAMVDYGPHVLAHARARLAPWQRVRRIEFAELPKTISGKIRRVELRGRENDLVAGGTGRPDLEWREEDFPDLRS